MPPKIIRTRFAKSDPFPLFHWSPTANRGQINRYGFRPGMLSTDRLWRPPMTCFAGSPSLAWELSGRRRPDIPAWDLWQIWSDVCGMELIFNTYVDSGESYVQEYRVYERVFKRNVWYVATRPSTN